MKRAQTQAVTLVLISGIIIALVGFAYAWGKPMIDKRTVVTQFTSAVRFMEGLDRNIVEMAGTCSVAGACEDIFELPLPGLIRINESANTITFEFQVSQPLIKEGEVFFNTADNGTYVRYGETPGVISMKGQRLSAGLYTLKFLLRYRELDSYDPVKGYKIQLQQSGVDSGNSKVIIVYEGSETQPGQAHNSGDLVVSKIKVQFI